MGKNKTRAKRRKKIKVKLLLRFARRVLFSSNETTLKKAQSMALASFMAFTPLYGLQTYIGIALAFLFKLNKVRVAILINIVTPYPIVPLIIYFSFKVGGIFVNAPTLVGKDVSFSWELLQDNLVQYLLGGFLLAIIMGLILGILSYPMFKYLDKKKAQRAKVV